MIFNKDLNPESLNALKNALNEMIQLATECIENITDEEQCVINNAIKVLDQSS